MERDIKAQGFVGFMVSAAGRWVRVILGALLIVWACVSSSFAAYFMATIGLLIFADGALDLFVLGPFFGVSAQGSRVRRELRRGHLEELSP